MGRIADAFARARAEERAALVIYLCAGDPSLEASADLLVAAAEAGADVIELGVPFSDPSADGPAIQRASERALAGGASLRGILELVSAVRARTEVPILLFGYYNPFLVYGEERVAADARAAGVDGFLVVDLPPEEAAVLRTPVVAAGLDWVPLVAPTSDTARVQLASDLATAFVDYVSMTGVTGSAASDLAGAARRSAALEQQTGKPFAVGFGVKTPEDVRTVSKSAAGVVVGSQVVRTIEASDTAEEARRRVTDLVASFAGSLGGDSPR